MAFTPLPRARPRLGVIVPGLMAATLIAGSIATAIFSLGHKPDALRPDALRPDSLRGADAGRDAARQLREARIEAPFAPQVLRPLSPEQALAWNAAAPTAASATGSASAFRADSGTATDIQRSLRCLTMAVYYEAGNEPDSGERAVAQVVLNRVRHPAYPKTVCGVVLDGAQRGRGCQFTFVCDGALARTPAARGWQRAERVAVAALAGAVFAPVGWATHYHASYVVPYWAASLDKVAVVGAHIFYRWTGPAGREAAFRGRYAGNEPVFAPSPATIAIADIAAGVAAGDGAGAGPAMVPAIQRPVLIATRIARPPAVGSPSAPSRGSIDRDRSPMVDLRDRRVLARAPTIGETMPRGRLPADRNADGDANPD